MYVMFYDVIVSLLRYGDIKTNQNLNLYILFTQILRNKQKCLVLSFEAIKKNL